MNELTYYKNPQAVAQATTEEFAQIFRCDNIPMLQLNELEQKAVAVNFRSGLYVFAAEIVWRRTISILRDRLSLFGEEFIGDMLGYNRPVFADDLSENETIDLNYEVGYLKQYQRMELSHHSEQIREYTSRQYQMMDKTTMNETTAYALIKDCIDFVLSDATESSSLEFNNIRNVLKTQLLTRESSYVLSLKNEQYFAKRTVLRSLMNLSKTEKEEEKQAVYHNMAIIIPMIWEDLAESDKFSFGTAYAEISSSEKKEYINVMKKILHNVHGFDYVPENLKSNSFISMAKHLINVHDGFNNFYNEPLAAKLLASMGTMIPNPAVYECVNAVLICMTGNSYGISDMAQEHLQAILNTLTINKWELYLKDLGRNVDMMYQLGYVQGSNDPVKRWCTIVIEKKLNNMNFQDEWLNKFLRFSSTCEYDKVRKMASSQYKKIVNM